MASTNDAVASVSTDLDRAPLDAYNATENHLQDGHLNQSINVTDEESKRSSTDTDSKVLDKVRHLTTKVKSKFHLNKDETFIHGDQRVNDEPEKAPMLAPPAPTARESDRFFKALPEKPSGPSFKEVVTNPVKSLKSAAEQQGGNVYAENLAKTDVTHGANVNVVRAYDKVVSATTGTDRTSAMQDLESLKKSRQDSFVRWTLDRHVKTVRRIEPAKLPRRPKREFMDTIDDGKHRLRWKEYAQYVCTLGMLLPP